MVQLITMVQMYHPIPWYHGFWGGTIVPWYTMVPLITVVQIYHHKHQCAFTQGKGWYICTTVISCTLVYHGTTDLYGTSVTPQRQWYLKPWYYHGKLYIGFRSGTIVPWETLVQLITMVRMYHLINNDIVNHGTTMMKLSMIFEVVQLITMVQMYRFKNHGSFNRSITMVNCTLVFKLVHLYQGIPWCN
jgi:hypothetical protein